MAIKTKAFDAAKYFDTVEAQAELISDALKTGHAGYVAAALGTVARARGMAQLAEKAGLSRQALYSALSKDGNPTLDTVMKVVCALGVTFEAKPVGDEGECFENVGRGRFRAAEPEMRIPA